MTHLIAPPRTAERLLEALGAQPGFRDAVLGDLAEEYAIHAAREGVGRARRWYYHEALRATPHLLRDWTRHLSVRDAGHVAGAVLASYLGTLLLVGIAVALLAYGARDVLGVSLDDAVQRLPAGAIAVALILGTRGAMLGGYIAAALGARAPLVSAAALGLVWSGVLVMAGALGGPTFERYRGGLVAAAAVLIVIGAMTGGMTRVGRAIHPPAGRRPDGVSRW
jgi:hypothetical protein